MSSRLNTRIGKLEHAADARTGVVLAYGGCVQVNGRTVPIDQYRRLHPQALVLHFAPHRTEGKSNHECESA